MYFWLSLIFKVLDFDSAASFYLHFVYVGGNERFICKYYISYSYRICAQTENVEKEM